MLKPKIIGAALTPQPEPQPDVIPEIKSPLEVATGENLPILEAVPYEINLWHASGGNVLLQPFLIEHGLDDSSPNLHRFNKFLVGFDKKNRRATFAIDDTHYYAIQFGADMRPADSNHAERVIEVLYKILGEAQ